MEKEHPGNVTQLNAYRKSHLAERQEVVRQRLIAASQRPPHEAATAMVGITVMPNGHIKSDAIQIEPEHVIPVLSAMRAMMQRLESCLTESISARHLMLGFVAVALIVADSVTDPAFACFLR